MILSRFPIKTIKETPKEADIPSHQLLLRGGFIRQVSAGVFNYLPMMWRVMRKVENIIREEMDRAGAIEMSVPILQPKELWQQTGRWDDYLASGTMFVTQTRKGAEFGLSPTAEEVITALVAAEVSSYRELPFNLYQIGLKFRNERRPRGGLLRLRQFWMKDAYSFDKDENGVAESYEKMRYAYMKIFQRCGLKFIMVSADSGDIGGSFSHEFMSPCEVGEDTLLVCDSCDYGANIEAAVSRITTSLQEEEKPLHLEATPNARTVEDLERLFGMPAERMVKTILYNVSYKDGSKETVAILMRGDLGINEVKLAKSLDNPVRELAIADRLTVEEATGAEVGFAGPVGLSIKMVADESVRPLKNFLCGANRTGYHLLDVNLGRDFPTPVFKEIRNAMAGDGCQRCDGHLQVKKGIELGHLFKLGAKYSRRPTSNDPTGLAAVYLDGDGQEHDILMGCYGIGLERIIVAAIELNHDEHGIVWPISIAPYHTVIVVANSDVTEQMSAGQELYKRLCEEGIEVVLDDRKERIGFKLNDADLIGYPYKIIVGRFIEAGIIELKDRLNGEVVKLRLDEAIDRIASLIRLQLQGLRGVE